MRIKKEYIIYGMLLFVFFLMATPWVNQGVPITDDYRHHVSRIFLLKEEISSFNFHEWVPNMYGGWPFFHFYHPMFYLIAIPFIAFSKTVAALKVMTLVAFLVSLFGTFYGVKKLFRNEDIALFAAVAYSLSSHFLFHATVSGALPRLMALAILPLSVSLFLLGITEQKKNDIIIGGISLAALLMMHVSVAIPALIVCCVYVLFIAISEKKTSSVMSAAWMFLILLGLSAAWLVPFFAEREYSTFEGASVLDTPHLAQSFRTFGIYYDGKDYIRSNYFGYSVLALAALSLFFIRNNKLVTLVKVGFISSVLLYFNLFSILNYIPLLKTALTWNTTYFIGILAFNAVLLAAVAAEALAKKFKNQLVLLALIVIVIVDLYPAVHAFSYTWVNQPTENFVNPPQLIDAWNFIKQQDGDFAVFSAVGQAAEIYHGKQEFGFEWVGCPQCVQPGTSKLHNELWQNFQKGIKDDKILGFLGVKYYVVPCTANLSNVLAYSNGAVCVYENEQFRPLVESTGTITSLDKKAEKVTVQVIDDAPMQVVFKETYFKPHWHAYIDGKETQIEQIWPEFMLVNVPVGEHTVVFKYKTNILHIISWFATLFTIILIYLALKDKDSQKSYKEKKTKVHHETGS